MKTYLTISFGRTHSKVGLLDSMKEYRSVKVIEANTISARYIYIFKKRKAWQSVINKNFKCINFAELKKIENKKSKMI